MNGERWPAALCASRGGIFPLFWMYGLSAVDGTHPLRASSPPPSHYRSNPSTTAERQPPLSPARRTLHAWDYQDPTRITTYIYIYGGRSRLHAQGPKVRRLCAVLCLRRGALVKCQREGGRESVITVVKSQTLSSYLMIIN